RPGGSGRPTGDRPAYGDRPQRDRPAFGDRPQRDRPEFSGPPRERSFGARPPRPAAFAPRPMDDGGMSIRLDPRRLGSLKLLAAEAGLRPGELVTRWVEERLDAARSGASVPSAIGPDALASLAARVDELAHRLDQMAAAPAAPEPLAETPVARLKRGPGRPRKAVAAPSPKKSGPKIALHDEITAVISERGPQTAAELASAIVERGRYQPPRSKKPLDAAQVNARVSNPTYRRRFVRNEHRIGLAAE
ncbi:MAG: hypothetical protein ACXWL8_05670, partial [Candidatus Limnocylindria bacterium]